MPRSQHDRADAIPLREALSTLVLVSVAAYPYLDAAIARLVDHVVVISLGHGAYVVTATGGGGYALRASLLMTVALCCIILLLMGLHTRTAKVSYAALYFTLAGLCILMAPGSEKSSIFLLVTILAAVASGSMSITARSFTAVGYYLVVATSTTLLYGGVGGDQAWQPCRDDKCSPAGALLQGFFFHENAVAICLVLLFPALAYVKSATLRLLGILTTLSCMVLSGSRSSLLAIVLCFMAYWVLQKLHVRDPERRTRSFSAPQKPLANTAVRRTVSVMALIPVGTLLFSTIFLFVASADALSYRGSIGQVVATGIQEHPLFGAGRIWLSQAFHIGQMDFIPQHEHSQAGYVLNNTGMIGFSFYVAMLIQAYTNRLSWGGAQLTALLAGPAIAGMTEPVTTSDLSGVPWTILTLVLLCSTSLRQPSTQTSTLTPALPNEAPTPIHR